MAAPMKHEKFECIERKLVPELTGSGPCCLETEFRDVHYNKRLPVVLKGLDVGPCLERWTWDYLASRCSQRQVKVHVAPTPQMDFISKNFAYKTLRFDDFIRRVQSEHQDSPFFSEMEHYYLRSVGSEDARKQVADVRRDFPELAEDVRFPALFDEDRFFSSVFRIASQGIQLWTHYDVMDNMLMVISGVKRVVLYDPQDALLLYLKGDKSQVLDVDAPDLDRFPDFIRATPHECVLHPGDVLFIPALWFHNVNNVEAGVAVNVFWRHLSSADYDPSDPYGNKDLRAAARADAALDRALKALDGLPVDGGYREFYARRAIDKIRTKYNLGDL